MTSTDVTPSFNGIYGIPEVAKYLAATPPFTNCNSIPVTTLRYWIRTSTVLLSPHVFPTRQRFVTFLDLVSMRLAFILKSRGIKLQEIRSTRIWLEQELKIEWPFANRLLWTYGSHVFIQFRDHLLAASKSGQLAMDFLEDWLEKVEIDMEFDANDKASSWSPYDGIQLDPKIQFGEPCIEGTRIPTYVIGGKQKAGDSLERIAALYNLEQYQVENAIRWEQRLDTINGRPILFN